MAHTLTSLGPAIYEAVDVVSRELVGFANAVSLNASADRAGVGDNITSPVVPALTAYDITPAATAPTSGDITVGNTAITISNSRGIKVTWNGEQTKSQQTAGNYNTILRDAFAQGMRTIVNELEADLAGTYVSASRAYGTAGTTPFGTAGDFSDASQVRRILAENGAPVQSGVQLVIDSAAGANLRGKQSRVDVSGDRDFLRQGLLFDIAGCMIRESGQVITHTKGSGASYILDGALAVGDTTVTVDTGSGTILAGDVVTIGNYKYVVASALSGGDFTVAAPGIKEVVADNAAVTVNATGSRNMAFTRDAIGLAVRVPAVPEGGDIAVDAMLVTDPVSGITFEIREYLQYRQKTYEVALAWGVKAYKPAHIAVLQG